MTQSKLILDYVLDHEARQANRVFLTQPVGGGQVIDYTWAQVMDGYLSWQRENSTHRLWASKSGLSSVGLGG